MGLGGELDAGIVSLKDLAPKSCSFDFPSRLPDDVKLVNNWHPLDPSYIGCPPKRGLSDIDVQKALEEATKRLHKGINMSKEESKLQYIKGLIEGALLDGKDSTPLLDKILKVIEE